MAWVLSTVSALGFWLSFHFVSSMLSYASVGFFALYLFSLERCTRSESWRVSVLFSLLVHGFLFYPLRFGYLAEFWMWVLIMSFLYALYGWWYSFSTHHRFAFVSRMLAWTALTIIITVLAPAYSLGITQASNGIVLGILPYLGPVGASLALFGLSHIVMRVLETVIRYVRKRDKGVFRSCYVEILSLASLLILSITLWSKPYVEFSSDASLIPPSPVQEVGLKHEYYTHANIGIVPHESDWVIFPHDDFDFGSLDLEEGRKYIYPLLARDDQVDLSKSDLRVSILDRLGRKESINGDLVSSGWIVWYVKGGVTGAVANYAKMQSEALSKTIVAIGETGEVVVASRGKGLEKLDSGENRIVIPLNYELFPYVVFLNMFSR